MSGETRKGFHSVVPYLTVRKPGELIDFVKHSFGAVEHFRTTGSAGGMHAEVEIGDAVVMIGGAEHIEPKPAAIHLYVPDVDDAHQRALEAGAKPLFPLADQPCGERSGGVEDPHGNRWYIATTAVPLDQIAKTYTPSRSTSTSSARRSLSSFCEMHSRLKR